MIQAMRPTLQTVTTFINAGSYSKTVQTQALEPCFLGSNSDSSTSSVTLGKMFNFFIPQHGTIGIKEDIAHRVLLRI